MKQLLNEFFAFYFSFEGFTIISQAAWHALY